MTEKQRRLESGWTLATALGAVAPDERHELGPLVAQAAKDLVGETPPPQGDIAAEAVELVRTAATQATASQAAAPAQTAESGREDDARANAPTVEEDAQPDAEFSLNAPVVMTVDAEFEAAVLVAQIDPLESQAPIQAQPAPSPDESVAEATTPGDDYFALQPYTVINHVVVTSGDDVGAIRTFGFNFNPYDNTRDTDSSILNVADEPALAAELGAVHGGDGTTTFGLPDLSGRFGVGAGSGPGLITRNEGDEFGAISYELERADLPASRGGTSEPIPLTAPSTAIVYAIRTEGIYPSRNRIPDTEAVNTEGMMAEIKAFATADAVPETGWLIADGSLLQIAQNQALFSLLGTTFGGDGRTTFGIPDLDGRVPVGVGNGPGLPEVRWGAKFGSDTTTLQDANIPARSGSVGEAFDVHQPSLGIHFIVALQGIYPSRDGGQLPTTAFEPVMGEIMMFAGNFAPRGFALAAGQLLPIAQNTALFSLFGTIYGGDGRTTFALPDLRGRAPIDEGTGFSLGAVGGFTTERLTTADIADLPEPNSLVVTTSQDVVDPLDYQTSLREAIAFALDSTAGTNGDGDADGDGLASDTITFSGVTQVDLIRTLDIDGDIIIEGLPAGGGLSGITITGAGVGSGPILAVTLGNVTLQGLTLDGGGTAQGLNVIGGDVTVDNSVITNGRALEGGGLFLESSAVTVINSTLSGNATFNGEDGVLDSSSGVGGGDGGAAFVGTAGNLTVVNSLVANNAAGSGGDGQSGTAASTTSVPGGDGGDGGSGGKGGGIAVGSGGTLTVFGSTISGNTAGAGGNGGIGGIGFNGGDGGDGGAGGIGGGIYVDGTASATIQNTTMSGNVAGVAGLAAAGYAGTGSVGADGTAGTDGAGGGLFVQGGVTGSLTNSLLVGNKAGTDDDLSGTIATTASLIGGTAASIFAQTATVTTPFGDVETGTLAFDGGPVQSIALTPSPFNPALDTGTAALLTEVDLGVDVDGDGTIEATAVSVDANGNARDVDLPGIGGTPDMGAVELQEARSLVVTTTLDVVDANDGVTSLREAIAFANDTTANGGTGDADNDMDSNDTITFAAGVGEAFDGGATITLVSALPTLTSDITIDGDGNVTIDGNDSHRIFDVTAGNAVFEELTLTGGLAFIGGAIRAQNTGGGTVTVDRSILTGNSAGGSGGAIFADNTGGVTVLDSTISNNEARAGGGILATGAGDLTVIRTTVADNMATDPSVGNGGGILSLGGSDALIVANSTVTGNTAANHGGGIATSNGFTILNTTIEGNTSANAGGGVFAQANGSILNSTITGNTATNTGFNPGGGGLVVFSGTTTVENTIILGNSADIAGEEDIRTQAGATLTDGGGNLLGNAATPADPADVFAAIDGTTGGGQLADNGGPVQTVALKRDANNPALDQGTAALPLDTLDLDGDTDTAEALPVDARGFTRDVDLPGVGGTPDMGAVELQLSAVEAQSLVVTTDQDVVDAFDGLTSLREAIAFANDTTADGGTGDADNDGNDIDTITFDAGVFGSGGTITLDGTQLSITSSITIDGDGAGDAGPTVTIDGDASSRIFQITGATSDVRLEGLTLTNGASGVPAGGAISAFGVDLTVVRSTVTGNTSDSNGGGILSQDGSLTVQSSTISDNTAGQAGGIEARDLTALTIIDSTISGNLADNAVGSGNGGGVLVLGPGVGDIQIVNATFEGNSAGFGGGLLLENTFTSALILNSTLTGNTATLNSGGIGVRTANATTMVELQNSIVLGNSAGSNSELGVLAGPGVNQTATITSGTVGDVFATIDATTGGGALADNGGQVQTVALKADLTNPAIDTGTATLVTEVDVGTDLDGDGTITAAPLGADARGFDRDVDVPGIGAALPDIGAFETQTVPTDGPDIIVTTTGNDTYDSGNGDDLLLADAGVDSIDGGAGVDTLTFQNSSATVQVDLESGTGIGGDAEGDTYNDIENLIGSEFGDRLSGDSADNTILGLGGNDILKGSTGNDTLDGGAGFDFADYRDATGPLIIDLVTSSNSSQLFRDDTLIDISGLFGAANFQNTFEGDENRTFFTGGSESDILNGNGGGDILRGRAGNDTIDGGDGSDAILGNAGNDTLTGGADRDVFWFGIRSDGNDIITDFTVGADLIGFQGTTINQLSDLQFGTAVSGWATVSWNMGVDSIELQGVTEIQANDPSNFTFI